jgi:hypothetical protein
MVSHPEYDDRICGPYDDECIKYYILGQSLISAMDRVVFL